MYRQLESEDADLDLETILPEPNYATGEHEWTLFDEVLPGEVEALPGQVEEFPGEYYEFPGEGEDILPAPTEAQTKPPERGTQQVGTTPMEYLMQLHEEINAISQRHIGIQTDFSDIDEVYGKLRGTVINKENVLWPTNTEFTITLAEKKIEDYVMKCINIQPPWSFNTRFVQGMPGCYRNKYVFQVLFSTPSKESPISEATVSIFFVFDIDVYGGKDETVKVHYVIEGNRYPHVPGRTRFQQSWLTGVLQDKVTIQKILESC